MLDDPMCIYKDKSKIMWINVLTMTRKNEPLSKQLSFEDEPKRMIEMITYLKRNKKNISKT